MTRDPVHSLLTREATLVTGALVVITALGWWYVLALAADMHMGDMDMSGFRMAADGLHMVMTPATAPWSTREFVLTFVMWAVMMVGMMTPSATPLVLVYAHLSRAAVRAGRSRGTTIWSVSGYLATWVWFAFAATVVQWGLQRKAWLTPDMATPSRVAAALVLIAAGLYQWTPFKSSCLSHCRSPFVFLLEHGGFSPERRGAFTIGWAHGLRCVLCCWLLMALLFVGGVMNLLWIAALSVLALAEKAVPSARLFTRAVGVALCAAGIWYLVWG